MNLSKSHLAYELVKQANAGRLLLKLVGKSPAPKGLGSFPRYSAMMQARRNTPAYIDWGLIPEKSTSAAYAQGVTIPTAFRSGVARASRDGQLGVGASPYRIRVAQQPPGPDAPIGNALLFKRHTAGKPDVWRHELTHMYQHQTPGSWLQRFANNMDVDDASFGLKMLIKEIGAFGSQFRSPVRGVFEAAKRAPGYAQPGAPVLHNLPWQALQALPPALRLAGTGVPMAGGILALNSES